MIDYTYDFDNQFFRMVTVALAKTMTRQIRWINYFEPTNENDTGRLRVTIPFYTSLTGDERFCLDAFVDDIVDKRVNLNTDQYQRGIITWTGFASRSDEFANPNQYLSQKTDINGTLRRIISKVKAVPISINYDIEIQLATSNEVDKCSQKLMNIFYNYMYFNIDYFGIKIDALLSLPDDKTIEIVREISMESERKKMIKFSLEVKTYYPIFRIGIDDLITCDNDDQLNWDYIGIPKPSSNFLDSLKNYNKNFGQTAFSGNGSTEIEGMTEIKRVYWDTYFHEINQQEILNDVKENPAQKRIREERNKNPNPTTWRKQDFDVNPIDDSESKPDKKLNDNDLDE
ncbi:MAG: hypothetical protein HPY57_13570 [Ignavibacteria bacterium]|nr:hypothetical protein [Ignavibacteria bacterium]